MQEIVSGYVVEGPRFHYLDKTRTSFRSHSVNNTPFVHQVTDLQAALQAGEVWVPKASRAYEGVFDPNVNQSQTKGEGMPFAEFVASLSATEGGRQLAAHWSTILHLSPEGSAAGTGPSEPPALPLLFFYNSDIKSISLF